MPCFLLLLSVINPFSLIQVKQKETEADMFILGRPLSPKFNFEASGNIHSISSYFFLGDAFLQGCNSVFHMINV
jgi:hypothetical protein